MRAVASCNKFGRLQLYKSIATEKRFIGKYCLNSSNIVIILTINTLKVNMFAHG